MQSNTKCSYLVLIMALLLGACGEEADNEHSESISATALVEKSRQQGKEQYRRWIEKNDNPDNWNEIFQGSYLGLEVPKLTRQLNGFIRQQTRYNVACGVLLLLLLGSLILFYLKNHTAMNTHRQEVEIRLAQFRKLITPIAAEQVLTIGHDASFEHRFKSWLESREESISALGSPRGVRTSLTIPNNPNPTVVVDELSKYVRDTLVRIASSGCTTLVIGLESNLGHEVVMAFLQVALAASEPIVNYSFLVATSGGEFDERARYENRSLVPSQKYRAKATPPAPSPSSPS